MGMTQDMQKALGATVSRRRVEPRSSQEQLWCQPGLSGPLPSMSPSRVTVGVKWDTTQQQVTKKPSLLPPLSGPSHSGCGLSPAAHPHQAPR